MIRGKIEVYFKVNNRFRLLKTEGFQDFGLTNCFNLEGFRVRDEGA